MPPNITTCPPSISATSLGCLEAHPRILQFDGVHYIPVLRRNEQAWKDIAQFLCNQKDRAATGQAQRRTVAALSFCPSVVGE